MNWSSHLQFAYLKGLCTLCDAPSGRHMDLCHECEADLPWLLSACRTCGLPMVSAYGTCGTCLSRPPPFTETQCAFTYRWPISRMISDFKNNAQLTTGRVLTELMLLTPTGRRPDVIVPVPLHRRTERRRGFNQSAVIAATLAKAWSVPLDDGNCRRIIDTQPQKRLSRPARFQNMRNAFAVRRPFTGEHIMIVDDVITTTATVSALARALLTAGAGPVSVMCLARTDPA